MIIKDPVFDWFGGKYNFFEEHKNQKDNYLSFKYSMEWFGRNYRDVILCKAQPAYFQQAIDCLSKMNDSFLFYHLLLASIFPFP